MTFYPNGQNYQVTVAQGNPASIPLTAYDPVNTVVHVYTAHAPIQLVFAGIVYPVVQEEDIKLPAGVSTLNIELVDGSTSTIVYINFGQEIN